MNTNSQQRRVTTTTHTVHPPLNGQPSGTDETIHASSSTAFNSKPAGGGVSISGINSTFSLLTPRDDMDENTLLPQHATSLSPPIGGGGDANSGGSNAARKVGFREEQKAIASLQAKRVEMEKKERRKKSHTGDDDDDDGPPTNLEEDDHGIKNMAPVRDYLLGEERNPYRRPRPKLKVDATTNYKQMQEMFTPEGVLARDVHNEVQIPLDLFEAVQNRQAYFKAQFEETRIQLDASSNELAKTKKELEVTTAAKNRSLQENVVLESRVKEFQTFNRDISLKREAAENKCDRLTGDITVMKEQYVKREKEIKSLLVRVEQFTIEVEQKEKTIRELRVDRAKLEDRLHDQTTKLNASMRIGKSMRKSSKAPSRAGSSVNLTLTVPDIGIVEETGESSDDEDGPAADFEMIFKKERQLAALMKRIEANERQAMELFGLNNTDKTLHFQTLQDIATVGAVRNEDPNKPATTAQDATSGGSPQSSSVFQINDELKTTFFSATNPFPDDSPFAALWEYVRDSCTAAQKGMHQTFRTFERFEATLQDSLSIKELEERWARFAPKWKMNCQTVLANSFETLMQLVADLVNKERTTRASIQNEAATLAREHKEDIERRRAFAVAKSVQATPDLQAGECQTEKEGGPAVDVGVQAYLPPQTPNSRPVSRLQDFFARSNSLTMTPSGVLSSPPDRSNLPSATAAGKGGKARLPNAVAKTPSSSAASPIAEKRGNQQQQQRSSKKYPATSATSSGKLGAEKRGANNAGLSRNKVHKSAEDVTSLNKDGSRQQSAQKGDKMKSAYKKYQGVSAIANAKTGKRSRRYTTFHKQVDQKAPIDAHPPKKPQRKISKEAGQAFEVLEDNNDDGDDEFAEDNTKPPRAAATDDELYRRSSKNDEESGDSNRDDDDDDDEAQQQQEKKYYVSTTGRGGSQHPGEHHRRHLRPPSSEEEEDEDPTPQDEDAELFEKLLAEDDQKDTAQEENSVETDTVNDEKEDKKDLLSPDDAASATDLEVLNATKSPAEVPNEEAQQGGGKRNRSAKSSSSSFRKKKKSAPTLSAAEAAASAENPVFDDVQTKITKRMLMEKYLAQRKEYQQHFRALHEENKSLKRLADKQGAALEDAATKQQELAQQMKKHKKVNLSPSRTPPSASRSPVGAGRSLMSGVYKKKPSKKNKDGGSSTNTAAAVFRSANSSPATDPLIDFTATPPPPLQRNNEDSLESDEGRSSSTNPYHSPQPRHRRRHRHNNADGDDANSEDSLLTDDDNDSDMSDLTEESEGEATSRRRSRVEGNLMSIGIKKKNEDGEEDGGDGHGGGKRGGAQHSHSRYLDESSLMSFSESTALNSPQSRAAMRARDRTRRNKIRQQRIALGHGTTSIAGSIPESVHELLAANENDVELTAAMMLEEERALRRWRRRQHRKETEVERKERHEKIRLLKEERMRLLYERAAKKRVGGGGEVQEVEVAVPVVPDWVRNSLLPPEAFSTFENDSAASSYKLFPAAFLRFHTQLVRFMAEARRKLKVSFPLADPAPFVGQGEDDLSQKTIADAHVILKFDYDALEALLASVRASNRTSTMEAHKKMTAYRDNVEDLRLALLDAQITDVRSLPMVEREALVKFRLARAKEEREAIESKGERAVFVNNLSSRDLATLGIANSEGNQFTAADHNQEVHGVREPPFLPSISSNPSLRHQLYEGSVRGPVTSGAGGFSLEGHLPPVPGAQPRQQHDRQHHHRRQSTESLGSASGVRSPSHERDDSFYKKRKNERAIISITGSRDTSPMQRELAASANHPASMQPQPPPPPASLSPTLLSNATSPKGALPTAQVIPTVAQNPGGGQKKEFVNLAATPAVTPVVASLALPASVQPARSPHIDALAASIAHNHQHSSGFDGLASSSGLRNAGSLRRGGGGGGPSPPTTNPSSHNNTFRRDPSGHQSQVRADGGGGGGSLAVTPSHPPSGWSAAAVRSLGVMSPRKNNGATTTTYPNTAREARSVSPSKLQTLNFKQVQRQGDSNNSASSPLTASMIGGQGKSPLVARGSHKQSLATLKLGEGLGGNIGGGAKTARGTTGNMGNVGLGIQAMAAQGNVVVSSSSSPATSSMRFVGGPPNGGSMQPQSQQQQQSSFQLHIGNIGGRRK